MKVSKESVDYRKATSSKRCGTCSMYIDNKHKQNDSGRCTLVEGLIRLGDTCNRWQAEKQS
jgi:hypothetical protein